MDRILKWVWDSKDFLWRHIPLETQVGLSMTSSIMDYADRTGQLNLPSSNTEYPCHVVQFERMSLRKDSEESVNNNKPLIILTTIPSANTTSGSVIPNKIETKDPLKKQNSLDVPVIEDLRRLAVYPQTGSNTKRNA